MGVVRCAVGRYAAAASPVSTPVPDQFEIQDSHGHRRMVPVPVGDFVIGSGERADVRLEGPGIEAGHLRGVRAGASVRLEPALPGATVRIGGEELFCKDLRAGDVVELAGQRLVWRPAAAGSNPPPSAPAPALARSGVAAAPRPSTRERSPQGRTGRRRPARRYTWWATPLLCGFLVLVGWLAVRHFRGSTWPASPQHYVDLAREQFLNNQAQRALDTLAFALREAEGPTRDAALQLEADIRRVLVEMADLPKLLSARQEHDLLQGYIGRYLRSGADRPAAREFVRSCDDWLARHREVCGASADGRTLLASVEAERQRYVAIAAIETPETAADVVFAARSRLRFQWRDYLGAFQRLDDFLRRGGANDEVQRERARMLAEGEEWLLGKLRNIDRMLAASERERDNAARDLDQLERWCAIPEWAGLIGERRRRVTPPR